MKKTYIIPATSLMSAEVEQMLANSVWSEGFGIGYGGVDEDGSHDPEVKESDWSDWDEE